MSNTVEDRLAKSLTSNTTEIIPYLPYLLQDLYQLGSSPKDMSELFKKYISDDKTIDVIDLACGKGSVSIELAQNFNVNIRGVDIVKEFIEEANIKAKEYKVDNKCQFEVNDINKIVREDKQYDCIIYGAVGEVLGNQEETLQALSNILKPNGYILMDDAYLESNKDVDIQYDCDYITLDNWKDIINKKGFKLIDIKEGSEEDLEYDNDDVEKIISRANELKEKHPELTSMFDDYIKSQQGEVYDLENNIVGATFVLRRLV